MREAATRAILRMIQMRHCSEVVVSVPSWQKVRAVTLKSFQATIDNQYYQKFVNNMEHTLGYWKYAYDELVEKSTPEL